MAKTGSLEKMAFTYDESGNPYRVDYVNSSGSTTSYYYVVNLQGDVTHIVNSSKTVLVRYNYNAFGEILSVTDTSSVGIADKNPLRYRGYVFDTETGLYYCQSRYYDPTMGRFINADGQINLQEGFLGYNLFAYCGNDPVNRVDPTGKSWSDLLNFFKEVGVQVGQSFKEAVPVYAGLGGAPLLDGPLPFADTIAAVAALALTVKVVGGGFYKAASKPKESTKDKAEDVVLPQTKTPQYWIPKMIGDAIMPGPPLTYPQARAWAGMGNDLLCAHQGAAIAIVKFYPGNVGPEVSCGGARGFLWHYHINRNSDGHIWYFGT